VEKAEKAAEVEFVEEAEKVASIVFPERRITAGTMKKLKRLNELKMKGLRTAAALGGAACVLAAATETRAQTNTPALPTTFQGATNQTASLALFDAALNLLPVWDASQTNSFQAGEFTLGTAPLWKSMTAAGNTPYNSTEADYFFTRNLGAGAEIISLGNGAGANAIDTLNVSFTLRKDAGNIAGYLLLDGGYGFNQRGLEGACGPGLIYQYGTRLRLFLDTRFEFAGKRSSEEGFLTRIGLQIPF
jgi:hypothetical protein